MSRNHVRLEREAITDQEVTYLVEDLDSFIAGERMPLARVRIDRLARDAEIQPQGYWAGNSPIPSAKRAIAALNDGGRDALDKIAPFGGRSLTNLLALLSNVLDSTDYRQTY